jgi:hypothetical protein
MITDTAFHGVDPQIVLNACQYTLVVGKVVERRPVSVSEVTVLGILLQYSVQSFPEKQIIVNPPKGKRRGWPFDQSKTGSTGRIQYHSNPAYTQRTLLGYDWKAWINHGIGVYSRPYRIHPVTQPEIDTTPTLMWGKTPYQYFKGDVEGNVENFAKQMLFVKMLGDDPKSWQAT